MVEKIIRNKLATHELSLMLKKINDFFANISDKDGVKSSYNALQFSIIDPESKNAERVKPYIAMRVKFLRNLYCMYEYHANQNPPTYDIIAKTIVHLHGASAVARMADHLEGLQRYIDKTYKKGSIDNEDICDHFAKLFYRDKSKENEN